MCVAALVLAVLGRLHTYQVAWGRELRSLQGDGPQRRSNISE